MLFLIFYFLLAAAMFFQGLHLNGEVKEPLGILPEEVAQDPGSSARWGGFLMAYGVMALAAGLAGFLWPFFEPLRPAVFWTGVAGLAIYAFWLLFFAAKVQFIGEPSAGHGDHGHDHHA